MTDTPDVDVTVEHLCGGSSARCGVRCLRSPDRAAVRPCVATCGRRTTLSRRCREPRRRRPVTARSLIAAPAVAASPAGADYEMPFPCGQSWTGTTRASHSPEPRRDRLEPRRRPRRPGGRGRRPGSVTRPDHGQRRGYGATCSSTTATARRTIYAHLDAVDGRPSARASTRARMLGTVGDDRQLHGRRTCTSRSARTARSSAPWFHGATVRVRHHAAPRPTASTCPSPATVAATAPTERRASSGRGDRAARSAIHRPGSTPRWCSARGRAPTSRSSATGTATAGSNPGVRTPGTRRCFTLQTPAGRRPSSCSGRRTDQPVAGDWDGDGAAEVGVLPAPRTGTFRLRPRRRLADRGRPRRRRRPARSPATGTATATPTSASTTPPPRRSRCAASTPTGTAVDRAASPFGSRRRPAGRPATGTATASPTVGVWNPRPATFSGAAQASRRRSWPHRSTLTTVRSPTAAGSANRAADPISLGSAGVVRPTQVRRAGLRVGQRERVAAARRRPRASRTRPCRAAGSAS